VTGSEALERIPYARLLGVRLERQREGLLCILPFHEDLVGNIALPAVHGGVVGAFLELTALVHLLEHAPEAQVPRPISFTIDFLRPAGPQDTFARAEIVRHGRRIANVRVLAWQSDAAKPVAAGIGNFKL